MFTLTIDNGSGPVDYTQYIVENSLQINDSINVPTTFQFHLANINNAFVVPVKNSYVRIVSGQYNRTFVTGFITNEPYTAFLGMNPHVPSFGFQQIDYTINVTADEWLLNVKAVPFIPVFINRTMGEILASLAETLAPGFFDTTGIQDGELIPYFQYDPEQKWTDLAKQWGDSIRFSYYALDKKLFFEPFDNTLLGITYDETHSQASFYPAGLQTQVLTVPPVNDCIVIGDVEPQNNHTDYFIGDGFTATFPLRHQMWNGAENILLQDDWTETTFSNSWVVEDPLNQFLLQGALNCIGVSGAFGQSYVRAANGVEIGGHTVLQHGLVQFNAASTGLMGAVFSKLEPSFIGEGQFSLNDLTCAFNIAVPSGTTVIPTVSGAAGITIQPMLASGQLVGTPVTTKLNHQYVLITSLNSPTWPRYNQAYYTLAGSVFGGDFISATSDITFIISDIDVSNPFNPIQTNTTYTAKNMTVPEFGLYALMVSVNLNVAVNYTLLSQPPQANLQVAGLYGPTGSQLPWRNPGALVTYPLGFGGIMQEVAQMTLAGQIDELQFYAGTTPSNPVGTIPAAGSRISLQSWESGQAIARVQDPTDIAAEGLIVGDDGLRTAIFSDLNPLPRTSVDCELAAQATITDRTTTQYDGTYTVTAYNNYFWNGTTNDYPRSGRFLFVNAPKRGIVDEAFVTRQVTTNVVELKSEVVTFAVSFGQDLFLEKLLARFLPKPSNVLLPQNAANPPQPQTLNQVGTVFLPVLDNATFTQITGTSVTVNLGASPITGCEVRSSDAGWGTASNNLLGRFTSQTFTLPRASLDQRYFLRQINGAQRSRFSKVLRAVYPLIPTAPLGVVDTTNPLQFVLRIQLTGDLRNIRGMEIRYTDNSTVLLQQTILSPADQVFTYDNSVKKDRNVSFYVYLFNLQWEYSPPLILLAHVPTPKVTRLHVNDDQKDAEWCVTFV